MKKKATKRKRVVWVVEIGCGRWRTYDNAFDTRRSAAVWVKCLTKSGAESPRILRAEVTT